MLLHVHEAAYAHECRRCYAFFNVSPMSHASFFKRFIFPGTRYDTTALECIIPLLFLLLLTLIRCAEVNLPNCRP